MIQFFNFHRDKYWFRLKRYVMGILKSHKSDKTIAWSYSLGTFVAILPTPGFSTFIGLALIAVFKQLNKMAVLLAMIIWNIFTVVPVYWFSFKIGQMLSITSTTTLFSNGLANEILQYLKEFMVGNLLITIPVSIISYFVAMVLLRKSRLMREKRAMGKFKSGIR
ncbi:DUF2062 domain-containing protein [Marivirga sp. S37H4]|uniref:DUF2062 domain-containing protein n=1 Tax=Marivirga aurantiaca TaxID=2802615 RepID=A0A934WX58_9BACT|nr:DUF2062 domain-containing protein [Marivirga aurantiaca]MBK6264455.1 DUF2062 domain-containing protein [Marivirga aurantiaca]